VHEVILVDGNSVDGTVAAARAALPSIRVVQQTRRGKGNALACGFAAATGDIIIMFDADGSADPAEIPRFVDALLAGADFAKGTRFSDGGRSDDLTRFRAVGNSFLCLLANRMLRAKYTDLCYGYNAFWTDILDSLELVDHRLVTADPNRMLWGDGFEVETVINCRIASAALRVAEVGSAEKCRIHGESNLRAISDGFRVLHTIRIERRRARTGRPESVESVESALPLPNLARLAASEDVA
jgi:glycosyltransferase involved in cell wall biosynthesis